MSRGYTFEKVPASLKEIPQWVMWESVDRDGKPTKVPKTTGGKYASSTNPKTWTTYEKAVDAYERHAGGNNPFDGIGFVFTKDAGVIGIDLDKCIDPDGQPDSWAIDLIQQFDSYTELTPSEAGFHILVKGDWEWSMGRRKDQIEVYGEGRYFTMTGWPVTERKTVEPRPEYVNSLIQQMPQPERIELYGGTVEQREPTAREEAIISHVLRLARSGINPEAKRFSSLWNNEDDHESASEGDYDLAHLLAFWVAGLEEHGEDAAFLINTMITSSGRYRQKWNRESYAGPTIARALDHTDRPYGWGEWEAMQDRLPAVDAEYEEEEREEVLSNFEEETKSLFYRVKWADVDGPFPPPKWLWDQRVPLNEVTVLSGDGEVGKSTLALDLAAQLSRGELRGEFLGHKGRTFYLTDEGSFDAMIQPKYAAAGGLPETLGSFEAVEVVSSGAQVVRHVTGELGDIEGLREMIEAHDVKLMIVDPIDLILGDADSNSVNEVRPILSAIQAAGCTVLAIRHHKKGQTAVSGDKILGSGAFRNFPRSVLMVDFDKNDEERRIMVHNKSNYGPRAKAMAYRIVESDLEGFGRVEWEPDEFEMTANELMSQRSQKSPSEAEKCATWMLALLIDHDGEILARKVKNFGQEAGYSLSSIQRAREILDLEVVTRGQGGKDSVWRVDQG